MKPKTRTFLSFLIPTLLTRTLLIPTLVILFVVFCVVSPPDRIGWTGFKKDQETSTSVKTIENGKETTVITKDISGKTLWDWMSLILAPVTLAGVGFWFQHFQQKQADKAAKLQQKQADEAAKEEVLQAYFDRLSELLIDKNVIALAVKHDKAAKANTGSSVSDVKNEDEELIDAAKDVIRARTLSILRRLAEDGERKASVVQFLIETEIISKLQIDLRGADLSFVNLVAANLVGANLSDANLSDANLSGANLSDANLSGANLRYTKLIFAKLIFANLRFADLAFANLNYANLSDANLNYADFFGADLRLANLSGANLSDAKFLRTILFRSDLSASRNLKRDQLIETDGPILCDIKLPDGMQDLSDRDCGQLPSILLNSYPDGFRTLDEAKQWVESERNRKHYRGSQPKSWWTSKPDDQQTR